MNPVLDELKVFTGNAHPELARSVCRYLDIPLGKAEVFKFANDNTFVRIQENIRQRDVFIIQPTCYPVNDNLMELLIMIDACKRASAGRITAVVPYYGYGRTDKKDQPRVPITARLVADLLTAAGADRLLTVDLHAGQIQGFFNIPLDELTAIGLLSKRYLNTDFEDLVVVAADVGAAKKAHDMADLLDAPIAIIEKERLGNNDQAVAVNVIGNVEGRKALIVEDEINTGSTMVSAVELLKEQGATEVYCCAVHPILSGTAAERLENSSLKELLVTDTLPVSDEKRFSRLQIVSVAGMLGEAIHRIHSGLSVGAMFEKP
jgi:ribose-phosphate pyrophosphokinase